MYNERDLLVAKVDLVSKTKMLDFAADEYRKLYNKEPPAEMKAQADAVHEELTKLRQAGGPLVKLFLKPSEDKDAPFSSIPRENWTLDYLNKNYQVGEEHVEALYSYAKQTFDCGRYQDAADMLQFYCELTKEPERKLVGTWGKLAAEILMMDEDSADSALDDLNKLRELIDAKSNADRVEQMQQRSWMIHWSLCIFFKLKDARSRKLATDFFFQDKIMNTILMWCPHVLRYVVVAVLLTKATPALSQLLYALSQVEQSTFCDPMTEFIRAVVVDFDFEEAGTLLKECQKILETDYFLQGDANLEDFMTNARLLIFDTYCRIHKHIDIKSLGNCLGLAADQVEPLLVGLMKEARVEAKMDAKEMTILVATPTPNVHGVVLGRSKGLTARTDALRKFVEKKIGTLSE